MNFFTEIETKEINELFEKERDINKLKILLANEATKILHGKNSSITAEKTAKETFGSGGFGKDLPEIKINQKDLINGINILDLLASNKIFSSKSEVRRAIKNNAIKINNIVLYDEKKSVNIEDFGDDKILKISFGKKKHYLLKII